MKLYFIFTKKGLAVIIGTVIIALIILSRFASAETVYLDGSTNAKRISYLQGLGFEIDSNCVSSKTTLIPEEFSDVYEKYNQVQREAGFDLSNYKGKSVTVYTYALKNEENYINIMVCDGEIIGGDVSSHALGGSMQPLKKE